MAEDRDLISKEEYELNYILKKWGKKQSNSNKKILSDELDKFNNDDSFKPHNRENFYKYAAAKNILNKLEASDSSPLTNIGNGQNVKKTHKEKSPSTIVNTAGDLNKTEGKKKRNLLWIILSIIAIIIIILIIIFGLKNCNCAKPSQITTNTDLTADKNQASDNKLLEDAAKKAEMEAIAKINGILKQFTPVYFLMDKSIMIPGEEAKITDAALLLKEFKNINLIVEGHCAKIGEPENEMKLSAERAEKVKNILERILKENAFIFTVKGYGSDIEAYPNSDKTKWHLNRRVEIKAELKK